MPWARSRLVVSAVLAARMVLAAALVAALAGPAAARTEWDLYVYNPVATVAAVKGLNKVVEDIERETGGALAIRLHLGGSLPINTTTITQAVGDGVVQLGDDGYFLGNVPIAGLLRLPMLIRTREEYDRAAAIMEPFLVKGFERKGVLVLGQYLYPFQVIFSRRDLARLADVKGQKLRVTSPEQGEFIKRLGGVPVTLGAPEVPSALDRGVVDGALTASTGGGNTWKDLLKANYRFGVNYFNSVIIANKDAFGALAPEVQATVRRVLAARLPEITRAMAAEEEAATARMAEGGMIVTPQRAEDLEEATKSIEPYWDAWAKSRGPDAVAALKQVRAALGR